MAAIIVGTACLGVADTPEVNDVTMYRGAGGYRRAALDADSIDSTGTRHFDYVRITSTAVPVLAVDEFQAGANVNLTTGVRYARYSVPSSAFGTTTPQNLQSVTDAGRTTTQTIQAAGLLSDNIVGGLRGLFTTSVMSSGTIQAGTLLMEGAARVLIPSRFSVTGGGSSWAANDSGGSGVLTIPTWAGVTTPSLSQVLAVGNSATSDAFLTGTLSLGNTYGPPFGFTPSYPIMKVAQAVDLTAGIVADSFIAWNQDSAYGLDGTMDFERSPTSFFGGRQVTLWQLFATDINMAASRLGTLTGAWNFVGSVALGGDPIPSEAQIQVTAPITRGYSGGVLTIGVTLPAGVETLQTVTDRGFSTTEPVVTTAFATASRWIASPLLYASTDVVATRTVTGSVLWSNDGGGYPVWTTHIYSGDGSIIGRNLLSERDVHAERNSYAREKAVFGQPRADFSGTQPGIVLESFALDDTVVSPVPAPWCAQGNVYTTATGMLFKLHASGAVQGQISSVYGFDDSLYSKGDIRTSGSAIIGGNEALNGNLNVAGTSLFNGTSTFVGDADFESTIRFDGAPTIIIGAGQFSGFQQFLQSIRVNAITVDYGGSFGGVVGALAGYFTNSMGTSGSMTIGTDMTVTRDVSVGRDLSVTRNSTLGINATASNILAAPHGIYSADLKTSGPLSVGGAATVTQGVTANTLAVTYSGSFGGVVGARWVGTTNGLDTSTTLHVGGDSAFDGQINVAGLSQFNSVQNNGDESIAGPLSVDFVQSLNNDGVEFLATPDPVKFDGNTQTLGSSILTGAVSIGAGLRDSPPSKKTANYTLVTGADHAVIADASGGAITITLPPGPTNGDQFIVTRVNSGANAVTVARNGNNINQAASNRTLSSQNQSETYHFYTTNGWQVE